MIQIAAGDVPEEKFQDDDEEDTEEESATEDTENAAPENTENTANEEDLEENSEMAARILESQAAQESTHTKSKLPWLSKFKTFSAKNQKS